MPETNVFVVYPTFVYKAGTKDLVEILEMTTMGDNKEVPSPNFAFGTVKKFLVISKREYLEKARIFNSAKEDYQYRKDLIFQEAREKMQEIERKRDRKVRELEIPSLEDILGFSSN